MAVHHVALCYIADYSNSTAAADSLGTTTFVGVDNLISDKGGRRDATHGPNTSTVTGFDTGDVLIGNIRPYLKKVWLADRAGGCSGDVLAVRIRPEYRGGLDPSFLYYLLSSDQFFAFNTQHAKGAKMPRGDKRAILTYRIPLPPLEIQRNIVEVLDTFRSLEAKLEAELEARRRQYLHYRDNLLAPQPDALRTRLGDVALIGTGSHDTKDAIPDGDHVFYARGRDPLRLDSFDFDEQAIITAGDGVGVGKVFHFADGKYALHQRAYRIVPSAKLHPRYLYHVLLADFGRYLEGTSVHASVTSLRRPMFLNYPITVPPLKDQAKMVEVLDSFDALVNDLSIGLPAELAARRKQYEYYRDKLLTFPEAS